jgi:hypothetical protein
MKQELGGITSDFNGLLPGILEDTENLNPVGLFTALAADSTPTCECYTCPSGSGTESRFLNTTLSPDYDPAICTQETDLTKCAGSTAEGFTDGSYPVAPTIIALGLLVLLQVF